MDKSIVLVDARGKPMPSYIADGAQPHSKFNRGGGVGRRATRELDPYTADDIYQSNTVAKNVIDIPAEDLTRNGWTVKIEGREDLARDIESRLRQLHAKDVFKRLFVYARLYGDAGVYIGTNEDTVYTTQEPLDVRKLRKINYLNVFSAKKIDEPIINEDVFSDRYGEVEYLRIGRKDEEFDPDTGNKQIAMSQQFTIHHSRLFTEHGLVVEDELLGRSILETIMNELVVADSSLYSAGAILNDLVFKVYKTRDVAGVGQDMRRALAQAANNKFQTEALAVISDNEELIKQGTPISGVNELLDYVWDRIASAARMPKSILKGQEAGTITGASYDVQNYYSRISAMQENELRPHLERLVKLLLWASDEPGGVVDPDSLDWSIEFNPLWNDDAKTIAETRLAVAQTDAIYLDRAVIGPEEVKTARFTDGVTDGAKFNADSFDFEGADKWY